MSPDQAGTEKSVSCQQLYCYRHILSDTKLSLEPPAVTKGIDNFYQNAIITDCMVVKVKVGLNETDDTAP